MYVDQVIKPFIASIAERSNMEPPDPLLKDVELRYRVMDGNISSLHTSSFQGSCIVWNVRSSGTAYVTQTFFPSDKSSTRTLIDENDIARLLDYPIHLPSEEEVMKHGFMEVGYVDLGMDASTSSSKPYRLLLTTYGGCQTQENLDKVKQHFARYREVTKSIYKLGLVL
jgi:hypothetical protein